MKANSEYKGSIYFCEGIGGIVIDVKRRKKKEEKDGKKRREREKNEKLKFSSKLYSSGKWIKT